MRRWMAMLMLAAVAGAGPARARSHDRHPRRGFHALSHPGPTEAEMRAVMASLARRGRKTKPIQRYKGLGEMDADQLAETTMDPRHRTLRKVMAADLERAAGVFELLMGGDVVPRKDFIIDSAGALDRERIDA